MALVAMVPEKQHIGKLFSWTLWQGIIFNIFDQHENLAGASCTATTNVEHLQQNAELGCAVGCRRECMAQYHSISLD